MNECHLDVAELGDFVDFGGISLAGLGFVVVGSLPPILSRISLMLSGILFTCEAGFRWP